MAKERELRKQCRRLLNELDIQPPLDVAELCRKVGEQRGKPIRLMAHPIPVPGPFGVWISTGNADYILYQQETTRSHQNHIILHELGHIIAGHTSDENDDQLLASLYPDLEPDAVRRALRRTSYDNDHEREAETVATIILEWASVLDKVAPRASDGPARRIAAALADRLGWL
ncbi:ImmA/IrrE family metallo-endopeptidase [Lentzea tibetensis]|uniref:ImmA/IrrE family metallo-endopeptidase n=1 Tax=Lentzea tibetensis TaxID=2591470 RepID=A0A563ETL1_9PSEU|nr:ImmA/IrrE family metallo-endopeptidase [Lentzea tibetensis]TWP51029.1 ImmA/IrrE family metallo-endopeptidase [Lentzea tibetensis]